QVIIEFQGLKTHAILLFNFFIQLLKLCGERLRIHIFLFLLADARSYSRKDRHRVFLIKGSLSGVEGLYFHIKKPTTQCAVGFL
ncbi:MAG: hypothetical protein D3906_12160, partial [Candidatus Electrothrix sp. AUS1_2]|nr:hypothetical protein [Candidatus Electrothrix sp. AUS1_2]